MLWPGQVLHEQHEDLQKLHGYGKPAVPSRFLLPEYVHRSVPFPALTKMTPFSRSVNGSAHTNFIIANISQATYVYYLKGLNKRIW